MSYTPSVLLQPPTPHVAYSVAPKRYQGPSADEVAELRKRHLSAGQYTFYKKPLMLVEGKMQYCFDDNGKQYVDCYSNVCHIGHCHPHVVSSVGQAMSSIVSNTRYLHPTIVKYADRLKSLLPEKLDTCFFVNSGSEGNDLAMRLARVFTGRRSVVCLTNAYHGTTAACTGVSSSLSTGNADPCPDYDYCARDVHQVPVPDCYRGEYTYSDDRAGEKYAQYVRSKCDELEKKGDPVAAFIVEVVQGVGGQIVYPKDYLRRAFAHVQKAGGVCIADEVQTGFGRTGSHFWAFEAMGVEPDIVVMGKPIGNGFPLGAVVCTRAIAEAFNKCKYFNTNGGNPVACAAGLAVLEVLEADGLQENARRVAKHLMSRLRAVQARHQMVGDVRGLGLFIGVELVRDKTTKEPAVDETIELMERAKAYGCLLGRGGTFGNVLRIKPPLSFNEDDADFLAQTIDCILSELEREAGMSSAPGSVRAASEASNASSCFLPRKSIASDTSDDDDVAPLKPTGDPSERLSQMAIPLKLRKAIASLTPRRERRSAGKRRTL